MMNGTYGGVGWGEGCRSGGGEGIKGAAWIAPVYYAAVHEDYGGWGQTGRRVSKKDAEAGSVRLRAIFGDAVT